MSRSTETQVQEPASRQRSVDAFSERKRRVLTLILRLSVLVVVLGVWEWAGQTRGSSLTFPPASEVAVAFVSMATDTEVWVAAGVTLQSFVLGFGLALLVGLSIGVLTARFAVLDRLSAVYLRILMTAPLAPLVPLMVGAFGIGLASRVALVFVFAVAVIALNAQSGVRYVDQGLVEMSKSFGANERMVFRRIHRRNCCRSYDLVRAIRAPAPRRPFRNA